MFAQEFRSPWPGVLHDIKEYLMLTHLSLGRGRPGRIAVHLSKHCVAASELQPHATNFRVELAAQLPAMHLSLAAADIPQHKVEVCYEG